MFGERLVERLLNRSRHWILNVLGTLRSDSFCEKLVEHIQWQPPLLLTPRFGLGSSSPDVWHIHRRQKPRWAGFSEVAKTTAGAVLFILHSCSAHLVVITYPACLPSRSGHDGKPSVIEHSSSRRIWVDGASPRPRPTGSASPAPPRPRRCCRRSMSRPRPPARSTSSSGLERCWLKKCGRNLSECIVIRNYSTLKRKILFTGRAICSDSWVGFTLILDVSPSALFSFG